MTTWQLLKATFREFQEDNAPRLAAGLAYYTAFALAPLLVIAIAIAGLVLSREAALQQVGATVASVFGPTAGQAVNAMVLTAGAQEASGVLATIVGVVTLLLGASGVFAELRATMNAIWDVKPVASTSLMALVRDRFFSFGMVLGVGFLLLVSLILSAGLSAAGTLVAGENFDELMLGQIANVVVSLAITTALFALLFKVIPDVAIEWRDVWTGAVITALLFTAGKALIAWYLGRAATMSPYGAAGSFVALLLWIYYSSQILFFGAEFTQVYSRARVRASSGQELTREGR
jgi:membrane protein